MRRLLLVCAGLIGLALSSAGQVPCDVGTARSTQSAGGSAWTVRGSGPIMSSRWWDNVDPFPGYRIGDVDLILAAQVWLGGRVDDVALVSGTAYGRPFRPGPASTPADSCAARDRIWHVTAADLIRLEDGGAPTPDIREWPSELGAPVSDRNGNPNDYRPEEGDRPVVHGYESAWWSMHDGGQGAVYEGDPMVGLDVDVLASSLLSDPRGDAVHFRYHFTYLGTKRLEDAYVGFFMDPELGNWDGDRIGVDTLRQLGYAYDFVRDDVYTDHPPAMGVLLARGPLTDEDGADNDRDGLADEPGERRGISSFISSADEVHEGLLPYNHLRGLCRGESDRTWPIRIPGDPYTGPCDPRSTGPVTTFWFPGNPVAGTGWTEQSPEVSGNSGDRKFLLSSGPFTMEPGDEQTIDWVVLFSQGEDWKGSIQRLRGLAEWFLGSPEALDMPPRRSIESNPVSPPDIPNRPDASWVTTPWPNPAAERATMTVTLEWRARVSIELFDALGARRRLLDQGLREAGEHRLEIPLSDVPTGVYYWRVRAEEGVATGSIAVVR